LLSRRKVEQEESLLQQVFRERHGLHPAGVFEMGGVGREVKVGLKTPLVEGLKLVNKCDRHFSSHIGKPGRVDCVGRKQDTEKYRRFAIRIWSEREPDLADFPGVQQLGRFRHSFPELRWFAIPVTYTELLSRVGMGVGKEFRRAVVYHRCKTVAGGSLGHGAIDESPVKALS
jgi:hypothetical protein